MAQKVKHTVRLGIFVTVGVILFTLSIYYIGNRQNLFGKRYRISTLFSNAYGLKAGNNVRYAGINVGSVENISFQNDSTLKVDMVLDDKVKDFIKKGAIASIGTDGLVGNAIVNISPGSGNQQPIEDGDTIRSFSRTDPNDLLNTLGNTNQNIALLSLNLLEITEKINKGQGTLSQLISDPKMANDIAKSLTNLQTVTDNLIVMSQELNLSVKQISDGDGLLNYLLYDTTFSHQIESFVQNLDSAIITESKPIVANLTTATEDMKSATEELKLALEVLNKGEGTANTILRDTSAAQALKETLHNLNQGTASFNENMEALKHNFLFRKHFKKLEKQQAKQEKKANRG